MAVFATKDRLIINNKFPAPFRSRLTRAESEERQKEACEQAMREARESILELGFEWDKAVVARAKLVLRHQDAIEKIREAHHALLEAMIWLIEAKSDIAGLKDSNSNIMERLEQEKRNVQQAIEETTLARDLGRQLSEHVRDVVSQDESDATK